MPRLRFESISQLPERFRKQAEVKLAHPSNGGATQNGAKLKAAAPPSVFRPCRHARCAAGAGCSAPKNWVIEIPVRAMTTNRFISSLFIRDPVVRAARTAEVGRSYKEWKTMAYTEAVRLRIPTLASATVSVQAVYTGRLPDAGGLTMVGKAMVDGLVSAGVFRDDSPDVVLGEWYPAPRVDKAGPDRVVLTLSVPGFTEMLKPRP